MVSYQKWTAIAFEVARSRGMQSSQENSQQLIGAVVAPVWRERRDFLRTATVAEARRVAEDEIAIR